MYICLCEPVTDRDIRTAVQTGCRTLRDVAGQLGCCRDCGRCAKAAKEVIDATRAEMRPIRLQRNTLPAMAA